MKESRNPSRRGALMAGGVAILGAAFLLSWGAEVAQLDISQALAIAFLATAGVPTPRTYAVLTRLAELRRLRALAERLGSFVLKPARGSGGSGVVAISARDERGAFVKTSGASITLRDLEAHAADILAGAFSRNQRQDDVLLEYRVVADPVLASVSFGGVADVRLLVFLGVPVLAMLRLPTRRSDGRANLHLALEVRPNRIRSIGWRASARAPRRHRGLRPAARETPGP